MTTRWYDLFTGRVTVVVEGLEGPSARKPSVEYVPHPRLRIANEPVIGGDGDPLGSFETVELLDAYQKALITGKPKTAHFLLNYLFQEQVRAKVLLARLPLLAAEDFLPHYPIASLGWHEGEKFRRSGDVVSARLLAATITNRMLASTPDARAWLVGLWMRGPGRPSAEFIHEKWQEDLSDSAGRADWKRVGQFVAGVFPNKNLRHLLWGAIRKAACKHRPQILPGIVGIAGRVGAGSTEAEIYALLGASVLALSFPIEGLEPKARVQSFEKDLPVQPIAPELVEPWSAIGAATLDVVSGDLDEKKRNTRLWRAFGHTLPDLAANENAEMRLGLEFWLKDVGFNSVEEASDSWEVLRERLLKAVENQTARLRS